MNQPTRHLPGLDGLRGIAALVVVFLHGTLFVGNIRYRPDAACLAVDFFFMLSGFVIAHAYDERLAHGMTWRQFMAVRIIRLYPMLLLGTAMGAVLFIAAHLARHGASVMATLLMAAGSFMLLPVGLAAGTVAYPVNIAAWSLFFEFAANALYGSRFGRVGNRHLVAFVVVSGVAMVPMALWGGPYIEIGLGDPAAFLLGFVRVGYPFWVGVLLFRAVDWNRVPKVPIEAIGLTLALLLLAPVDSALYNLLLVLALFPLIVLFAASAGMGSRTTRACLALGELSYPLYLVHVPILRLINWMGDKIHLGLSPWVLIPGGGILSIVVAHSAAVAFDTLVRGWLSRARNGREPADAGNPTVRVPG
ncbi:MAG: acyltransferase family protein [Rhodopila sp.]